LILAPFINKQKAMSDDANFVVKYFTAHFIAKQHRIGDLQPIIISVGMDDYAATLLILVDKDNKYVSGYTLCGGLADSPDIDEKTVTSYPDGFADINGNTIVTYQIQRTDYTDTTKKVALIDSTITRVAISSDGHFKEKQIPSKQATIPRDQKVGPKF